MTKYYESPRYRFNNRWTIYTKTVRDEIVEYIQMSGKTYEELQYEQDRPTTVVKLLGNAYESWAFSPDGLGAVYYDTLEELIYGEE
jgi:hypothetical protein